MALTPRPIDAGVAIGEIFVDKYRVDSILGHGGMGVVAACTHLGLNERVAIKMLRREVLDDADAVERFMREAQAAVKLKSEYVARVTDVGRSRSNVPYMVMEYLEGHDLGDLLEERGSLGLPWAIELTLQACEALAEAHSLGIVHRDVKPTNLFVTWRPDGSALVKVLDFGISKALTGNAMQLTQTQSLLGTPAYMSPEQMRSARMVDARTDIWSLGTVLYEMLEGHRPFEAESFSEMCVKVAVDPPGSMTNAPLQLQQVVLRCLEKSAEQRYASMAELAHDLVPFSQDPHQAQVLVERMSRTLRRSQVQQVERSPSSGLSGPVRLIRSAERAAEIAPRPAETPRDAPGSGAATPAPEPGRSSETGKTSASLSATMAVARPKSRHRIAIVTAVAAATALGVAISLLHKPASERPEPRMNLHDTPRARASTSHGSAGGPPAPPDRGSSAGSPAAPTGDRGITEPSPAADPGSATPRAASATPGAAGSPAPESGVTDMAAPVAPADDGISTDPTGQPPSTSKAAAGATDRRPAPKTHRGNKPHGNARSGTMPANAGSGSTDCAFDGAHPEACPNGSALHK